MNAFFADYTKNISKGGTFIKTSRPLPVGTRFLFALAVPALSEPVTLDGEVTWVLEGGRARPRGGGARDGHPLRVRLRRSAQRVRVAGRAHDGGEPRPVRDAGPAAEDVAPATSFLDAEEHGARAGTDGVGRRFAAGDLDHVARGLAHRA